MDTNTTPNRVYYPVFSLPVIVAALGYFVDAYDMLIFSIVRVDSLKSFGLSSDAILNAGVLILNCQLLGMVIGGIVFGILGDKYGRTRLLFMSIITYSLATLMSAFVHSVETYAFVRFIAGLGLAGELGLSVTLVSELLSKEKRGWGTTLIVVFGVLGGLFAALISQKVDWRISYIIGAAMGFSLLLLRFKISDSWIFIKEKSETSLDKMRLLFCSPDKLKRFISLILLGAPLWFFGGIMLTLAPEITQEMGVSPAITVATIMIVHVVCFALGDFSSGLFSQLIKSRKKVIGWMLLGASLLIFSFLFMRPQSYEVVLFYYGAISLCLGYWAVFVTVAAESFGTNLRATVATSVPNFVRAMAIPLTTATLLLKPYGGIVGAMIIVYGILAICSFWALYSLKETYGVDLEYTEE